MGARAHGEDLAVHSRIHGVTLSLDASKLETVPETSSQAREKHLETRIVAHHPDYSLGDSLCVVFIHSKSHLVAESQSEFLNRNSEGEQVGVGRRLPAALLRFCSGEACHSALQSGCRMMAGGFVSERSASGFGVWQG